MTKTNRGPKKPIRAHVPGPVVEYSQSGRRILTPEEIAALKQATDKTETKSEKRKSFSVEASEK